MDNPTPNNANGPSNTGESQENIWERTLGAQILHKVNFSDRHKEIVDSSYKKTRDHNEKLYGNKPGERRAEAYLKRLDRIIEHGNKFEQQLWQNSTKDLIVRPEDIPESYWQSQQQILRDDGYGYIQIGESERAKLTNEIQKQQLESLAVWTDYFSDKNCPYPTWFKVYAWDGMSKLGTFNKSRGQYNKRDKTAVAPYPRLNPGVLSKIYDVITSFYGTDTVKDLNGEIPEDGVERNEELDALVKSGNFNSLYSYFLLHNKTIVPTPEKAEDVHGQWVEYSAGEENAIANAADGTEWCINAPSVASHYLHYDRYGHDDEYDYDHEDNSQAKFILFHLNDPTTGQLADNACASIRLDKNGQVAEISGLNKGQALEDSLVSIVEEKVKSLPGGEHYLEAFKDKHILMQMDRKVQNSEPLTVEELRFLCEIDRPIVTLDTYNNEDPRIPELKKRYDCGELTRQYGLIIPDVTTISDIQANVPGCVEQDPELKSNLLSYVLKKKIESGDTADIQEVINNSEMMEYLKNFETYETKNLVFFLPKDRWQKGKNNLPHPVETKDGPINAIAPADLTALLKQPIEYNYTYETDGVKTKDDEGQTSSTIYNDSWVGKEIHHFPWTKELLETNEKLLKPNGFTIPADWRPIIDSIKEIQKPGERLTDTLQNTFRFSFAGGFIFDGGQVYTQGDYGRWWSSTAISSDDAYNLNADSNGYVNPQNYDTRLDGSSVRCVLSGT